MDSQSIDSKKIHIVLNRLNKSSGHSFASFQKLVDKTIENEKDGNNALLLDYFVMLMKIHDDTKAKDEAVNKFVQIVNGYLKLSNGFKELSFNGSNLSVSILDSRLAKEIEFDALSSGEQQIVSIFAKLNFSDKKYIILIDEPEISLSVEWQRKFLPDICSSNNCSQLIAITHSPFIFENELEEYTDSLHSSSDLT